MPPEKLTKEKSESISVLYDKITIKSGINPFGWYHAEDILSALQWLKSQHREIGDSVYEDFNSCGQEHLVTDVLNVCRDLWWKKINEAFSGIYEKEKEDV